MNRAGGVAGTVMGLFVPVGALTQLVGDRLSVDCSVKPGVGGVTTQAGRVQHGTAQRGSGKVGGIHNGGDLRGFATRSASGDIIRMMISLSAVEFLALSGGGTLRQELALCYGVKPDRGESEAVPENSPAAGRMDEAGRPAGRSSCSRSR